MSRFDDILTGLALIVLTIRAAISGKAARS